MPASDRVESLGGHDVEIWTDQVQDVDALAERLRDTEALVLIRERTEIRALLRRPPKLGADQPTLAVRAPTSTLRRRTTAFPGARSRGR